MSGQELNAQQQAAVAHPPDAPLRVIAGAGTGKTTLLTERFLHHVHAHDIRPDRILCLTFTNKAAAHMRGKITTALSTNTDAASAMGVLWIDTFHSVAWRVLSSDLLGAGLPTDTRLATPMEQAAMRAEAWQTVCANRPDALQQTFGRRWENADRIQRSVFGTLDSLARDGIAPQDIEATLSEHRHAAYVRLRETLQQQLDDSPRFSGRTAMKRAVDALDEQEAAESATASLLHSVGLAYGELARSRHLLDFTSLLLQAISTVESHASWRARFDTILVDECQDTNGAQFRLLAGFAQPEFANVTVVGDRKQCIYAFQGARPNNLDRVTGHDVPLELNYRSRNPILDTAHAVISPVAPDDPLLRNETHPASDQQPHPAVWFARFDSEVAEAAWIADEIAQLRDRDVPLSAMAILVRTRTRMAALQGALELSSPAIPYTIVDKFGGWDRESVKTALALLRVACDPLDDLALVRLLQERPYALTLDELYRVCGSSREGRSVYEMLCRSSSPRLQECAQTVSELCTLVGMMPPAEFLSFAMQRWGLLDDVLTHDTPARLDFQALAALYSTTAQSFAGSETLSFAGFLSAIAAGEIQLDAADSPDDGTPWQGVRISNIHQVKGLEFPIVFVAGLGVGTLPYERTLQNELFAYDDELGFVQRRAWNGSLEEMARWDFGLSDAWKARQREEERRLLYVAITRAQHRCYLTSHTPRKDDKERLPDLHFVEALEDWIAQEPPGVRLLEPDQHPDRQVDDLVDLTGLSSQAPEVFPTSASDIQEADERINWMPEPVQAERLELSYTQVYTFQQCPRLYEYTYVARLPAPETERELSLDRTADEEAEFSTFRLGTLVHHALELMHGPEQLEWSDALTRTLRSAEDSAHVYRQAAENRLERYTTWDIANATSPIALEQGFTVKLGTLPRGTDVWLSGSIDRVDREPDGTLAIWDYKTGRLSPQTDAYALQLRLYALAAGTVLRNQVSRAGIIALGEQTEATALWSAVDVSAEALARTRESALTIALGVETGKWDSSAHADRPCERCRYRALCPDRLP